MFKRMTSGLFAPSHIVNESISGGLPVSEVEWHTVENDFKLPYQIIGDLEKAKTVIFILHGGTGGSITKKHVVPIVDALRSEDVNHEDVAVVVYNQRNAGIGAVTSKPNNLTLQQQVDGATPAKHVADFMDLKKALHLENKEIILFGASWGSLLGLLIAQNDTSISKLILAGFTFGESEELNVRYALNGLMATHLPKAFAKFVSHLPDNHDHQADDSGINIVNYYSKVLYNAYVNNENIEQALDMAADYGFMHILAANPTSPLLNGIEKLSPTMKNRFARLQGMDPLKFATDSMNSFARGFPDLYKEGGLNPIANLGNLANLAIYVMAGNDCITGKGPSDKLKELMEGIGQSSIELVHSTGGHDLSTGNNPQVITYLTRQALSSAD